MSRIGKQPITLPDTAQFELLSGVISVTGPKGSLTVPSFPGVAVTKKEKQIEVECTDQEYHSYQGLQRTLIANAIQGVTEGWKKDLELHGVGMRAVVGGTDLTLSLGFSHPVIVKAPEGIAFQVVKNVITVSGNDKQLVGETAANIRKLRKPEPYKGKGIRYSGEHVRRKAGKAGKAK